MEGIESRGELELHCGVNINEIPKERRDDLRYVHGQRLHLEAK
jgi:hypothetical protein